MIEWQTKEFATRIKTKCAIALSILSHALSSLAAIN